VIVADTNLVAYLLLPGERTRTAERVLDVDPVWAAPLLWRSELRNILATQVRAGRLGLADAQAVADQAERLLAGREYTVATAPVLELASSSGCAAYDCELVVLARELDVTLVTADGAVLDAFPETAMAPDAFATA